jgi:VIT1/CCC1 family predicted Fe2+/Mn2+ transporter
VSDQIRAKIRDAVFGLQDGLVSTLGATAGIAAGTASHSTVAIAGVVIVAVESLSMAAGSYLSCKSQREYLERLLEEERRAIEADPENERTELFQMYRQRGFTDAEIHAIAGRLFSNKQWLLEDMAHKELGICPARLEEPVANAVVMGLAYLLGGVVPVFPYWVMPIRQAVAVSMGATALALVVFGGLKGRLVGKPRLASGLEMLWVAGLACAVGWAIGLAAKGIVP